MLPAAARQNVSNEWIAEAASHGLLLHSRCSLPGICRFMRHPRGACVPGPSKLGRSVWSCRLPTPHAYTIMLDVVTWMKALACTLPAILDPQIRNFPVHSAHGPAVALSAPSAHHSLEAFVPRGCQQKPVPPQQQLSAQRSSVLRAVTRPCHACSGCPNMSSYFLGSPGSCPPA